MFKLCPCGEEVFCKPYQIERKKFCSKACQNKYHYRPSGLKYNIVKRNPTSFKKGHIPWNAGLPENQHNHWKGDSVGYSAIHSWVEKHLGKPRICEFDSTHKSKVFHWSNKSGKYLRDLSDWQRLCIKCHSRYDYEKFGARRVFYE